MKYDFDEPVERRGSGSYKWDIDEVEADVTPLWVADMDFKAAPAIIEALNKRVQHGVFGYTQVPESFYEATIEWFKERHQWTINRKHMLYTSGVVPALSCAIKAITMPGEKVLVHTPIYNCFYSSIRNNGCEVLESPLVRKADTYEIDFDAFDRLCADEKATAYALCNPHNPSGRVWTREELAKIGEICQRHHVRVISDEIHNEIVMPGYKYVPFASVSNDCLQNSVTLTSPSKSFNTAGLQIANIVCADDELRRRIDRAININEVCDVNPFGPIALEAAYRQSGDWIDQLNDYIWGNYCELKSIFAAELPDVEVVKLEGTYLAWVDITSTGLTSQQATDKILKDARVLVNSGTMYGPTDGEGYIRINLATQRKRLVPALHAIAKALKK